MTGIGDVKLHLVDNVDTAQQFLSWLGERRPMNALAVDTETGELPGNPREHAFSPWHGQLRLVQVGDAQQAWAIPWEDWKGVFYQGMDSFDGQIVCHNIAFEARWFDIKSRWSMPWHNAHDTMIMAHLIDPLGSGALKRLTRIHVDARAAALQETLDMEMAKNGWTWGTVPVNFQPYWAYGALDTILTMKLFEMFYEKCGPGGPYSIAYELEMAVRRIVTRMEINGARVDLEYSQQKYDQLIAYTDQVKSWAKQNYNGLSITSNIQLIRQFEALGADITERTASGQKSCTKDQLKILVRDGSPEVRALAETVLAQRKADKLATTYFANFIHDNVDGVVHPSVKTLGARTGRMSIQAPALQTLPAGDATVRRAFIPKDDDHAIVSSDLDQVEFRLTAALSGDPQLIQLFARADATQGDAFTEIMRDIYQDPSLQKSDPRRRLVKGCVPLSSQILTRRGWLTYDQVVDGDETLGYDFETGTSKWTKILGVHVFDDSDVYLLHNQHKSFLCTEDHRWVADGGRSGARAKDARIIYANELPGSEDRLILAAPAEGGDLDITPDEALLLGWILGDGVIKRERYVGATAQGRDGWRTGCKMQLTQTKPDRVAELDEFLQSFPVSSRRVNKRTGQVIWTFDPSFSRDLLDRVSIVSKDELDPWQLAIGLSEDSRVMMSIGLDNADGKSAETYAVVQAADSPVAELCVALGYLTGQYAKQRVIRPDGVNWQRKPAKVVYHQKATMTGQRARLDYVSTEDVWCVTTDLGTWTMRQDDNIPVLTGNTIYGKLYGAGVAKMALTAGVAEAQMKTVVDAFNNQYPGVANLQKQIEDTGMRRLRTEGQGYVQTRTGRRLPCDDDRVYTLMNYLVQSSAAEVFKQNLVKLDQADLTELLIVPVHDEIVLNVPRTNATEVMETVRDCMTTTEGWEVPLTAGVDGPFENWGEKYDGAH